MTTLFALIGMVAAILACVLLVLNIYATHRNKDAWDYAARHLDELKRDIKDHLKEKNHG